MKTNKSTIFTVDLDAVSLGNAIVERVSALHDLGDYHVEEIDWHVKDGKLQGLNITFVKEDIRDNQASDLTRLFMVRV